MCPLSLFGILLFIFIIFYAVKSIIILIAGAFLIIFVLKMSRKENFGDISTDPIDTGIENPLWGPLFPVESKKMTDQSYYTMKSLPWAMPILVNDVHV